MPPESFPESKQSLPDEFLNPENFLDTWGEKIDLIPEEFQNMWDEAEQYYTNLPYHNWLHVRKVLFGTMLFADVYETNGVVLDRSVLVLAALFHDTNFHENHTELGYRTKEEHSVVIFEENAEKHGYSEEATLLGKQAITATTAGTEAVSEYDVALVCSDLLGASSNFDTFFMPDGDDLSEEWNIMNPEKQKTRGEYIDFTVGLLSTYAVLNLGSGEYESDYDPREWIVEGIKANIFRLADIRRAQLGLSMTGYVNKYCNDFPSSRIVLDEAA